MNKTILITGASGNLGKASVEKFLNEGYTVLATVSPGKTLPFETSGKVFTYEADLTNEESVKSMVERALVAHPVIHATLLLVGGYRKGNIADSDGQGIKKMIELNFETAYHVARLVFQQMLKEEHGRIVFVGARPALIAYEGRKELAYALSKSLLFKLAELLNAEGSYRNVISSVIVPSTIDTPGNRAALPQADFTKWVKPEEIADSLFYLVSEQSRALREPIMKLYADS